MDLNCFGFQSFRSLMECWNAAFTGPMGTAGIFKQSWYRKAKTAPQLEGPFPVNLLISFVDDGCLGMPLSGWGINFGSPSCVLPCVSIGNLKLR